MRFIKSSIVSALLVFGIEIPLVANGQTYQMSGTVLNGYMEFFLTDWGNTQPGSIFGLGTYGGRSSMVYLDDNIYIDPAAQTIRQVGTIGASFFTEDIRTVNKTIGSQIVSATVDIVQWSAYYSGIHFDTGVRTYTWNSSLQLFTFDGRLPCSAALTGPYSLVTGGQTLAGNYNYSIGGTVFGYTQFSLETNFTIIGSDYTVRTLSGWGGGSAGTAFANDFSGTSAFSVTATNGFSLSLAPGLNDGLDFFRASADPDWAFLVPEPSVASILGLGLASFAIWRRHQLKLKSA